MLVNKFNINQMVRIIDGNCIRIGLVMQITRNTDDQGKFNLMYHIDDCGEFYDRPENEVFATTEDVKSYALAKKVDLYV